MAQKQYNSVDNRYQTPLKLPNLTNPASKRSSNATSGGHKQNQGHLSTVVESAYSRQNAAVTNGKMCTLCAKKHRIG